MARVITPMMPESAPFAAAPPLLQAPSVTHELEEGPLWNTIRKQLYRAEVAHVKRQVGEALIQQNKMMWNEVSSLRQMLADFQEQNDERCQDLMQQVQFRGTRHRDLLRRQAHIVLDDVRSQAESCGHSLEDLVPELKDPQMSDFLFQKGPQRSDFKCDLRISPPTTPSTQPSSRPSSASGVSGCSTPDPLTGMPPLPLGRQLGFDELSSVAEGIREALEAEQQALLAAIGEQMQSLEVEDQRRVVSSRGEPSTQKLQEFVHKLQDLAVSPSLRTLQLAGPPTPSKPPAPDPAAGPQPPAMLITGGANVRRLQALISQRRRASAAAWQQPLGAVPETPGSQRMGSIASPSMSELLGAPLVPGCAGSKPSFDPFFDDPFAA